LTPLSGGGASRRSPSLIDYAASILPQRLLRSGPRGVQGPPLVINPPDDRLPPAFSASTPVVLHILPKVGSSAPIGYIYDPDPSRDGGQGGLLDASAAFFAHQGHEVFRDLCPVLMAYRRAGRITSTIIDVDRLSDHILTVGLNLLESSRLSSKGDILGMSFMAEYLPAPPHASVPPCDHVSLSPPQHGGSGGTIRSCAPVTQPVVSVPVRSAHSVGGRSQLDPKPQGHFSPGSGRSRPSPAYGGCPWSRGGLFPSSIPSSVGFGGHHSGDA
jgi:hypothetical protein